jgi:hypothetical protein
VKYDPVFVGYGPAVSSALAAAQVTTYDYENYSVFQPSGKDPQTYDCKGNTGVSPAAPTLPLAISGISGGIPGGSDRTIAADGPYFPDSYDIGALTPCLAQPGARTFPERTPTGFQARTAVAISDMPAGGQSTTVQVSGGSGNLDCTAEAHAANFEANACSHTYSWTGQLIIRSACVQPGIDQTGDAPLCVDKAKKEAADSAAFDVQFAAGIVRNPTFCPAGHYGHDRQMTDACYGQRFLVAGFQLAAAANRLVADDPPDPNYLAVAHPSTTKDPRAARVRRHLPRLARWIEGYAKATGLLEALATTQNRATGAFLAATQSGGSQPNIPAKDALKSQDAAEQSYAREASAILRNQPKLARAAAREIRALSFQGRHRFTRLAATIASHRLATRDTALAHALDAISH